MTEEAKWYVVHTYSGYENKVKVDIENPVLCPRYVARVVKNVKIGPSPSCGGQER